MRAVVLAGGEGVRLRPLTTTIPKPMLPVAGTPILRHTINYLRRHGINDLTLTLHYLPSVIKRYLDEDPPTGVKVSFVVEDRPLGTAGSVKSVEGELDETFLVISGDLLTDIDLSKVVAFHKEAGSVATIVLSRVENPIQYGIVMVGEDSRVVRFLEKPTWGEVFTDTVNAGIYVLEPEVLKYADRRGQVDFSGDVFPQLLERKEPIYGYTAKGYWTDIGMVQQYLQANGDLLTKRVDLPLQGREVEKGLWVGRGVEVSGDATLMKPAFIGDGTIIKKGATVGDLTVLGGEVMVDEGARVRKAVVWDRSIVGVNAQLTGCVLASRCVVEGSVSILEEAVVGEGSTLGRGCTIKGGVKIWPDKAIEAGSMVNTDLRWGMKWMKDLFGEEGIVGLANIEITPESAAKLGAAVGTYLGRHARVVVGRDTNRTSRMLKRALTSGLLSSGVDAINLGLTPDPVARHMARRTKSQGGVFVGSNWIEPNAINIKIFNGNGVAIERVGERKIQDIFFREDLRRVLSDEVGVLIYQGDFERHYADSLMDHIDHQTIMKKRPRVVLDCSNGAGSLLIPEIFQRLGCQVASFNIRIDEFARPHPYEKTPEAIREVSNLVKSWNADLGLMFNSDGDRVVFIDEKGHAIDAETSLIGLAKSALKSKGKGNIVVPMTITQSIDAVAEKYGGKVIRSEVGERRIVGRIMASQAIFGGDEKGGYIFPEFQPCLDGIFASAELVETICREGVKVSEIMETPPYIKAQSRMRCPSKYRGRVMRKLLEEGKEHQVQTLGGIKIFQDEDWVAIIPSSEGPEMLIYAEAKTLRRAQNLIETYSRKMKELCGEG